MVKKKTSKLFHGLMALLLVVSVFVPLLRLNSIVSAAEKIESEYTLTTEPTINTNRLVDHAKYGEGKFYFKTTYTFPDNVALKNGDFMVYHVPNEFKIEVDSTTDLKAPNGEAVATLTTEKATNTAKITVTDGEYFKKFNENKQIDASFTVVWADHVEKNKEYEINIPGAGVYHLTRIVPDVDPTGFTKWGVQDSGDPNYVNWRVRVNRYAKAYTGVNIQDTIPDGQVLASDITGYYFPDWENGYGRTKLDKAHVQVTDKNHFTITPNGDGTLDHKGLYIMYRTRLTKPVNPVTKRVLNNVSVTTNEEAQPIEFEGFAPITTTDGIGIGTKSDEIALEVTKKLKGKTLEKDMFSFQLLDDKGSVLQTVKNDENGTVKFEAIKYKEVGTFKYTIKEVNDNKPGYTYDANVLKATVTVEDVLGEKLASVKFEDSKKEFTNTYAAKEAKLQLEAKKVLNGKAIEAGQFEFELKENGTVLHTVSNDANGKIQFPELTFTKEETRTFTITEKSGSEAGVTYDKTSHTVTVDVKDNGQGQLVATVTDNNPTFTNTYKATPAKATITATKVLDGKALEADKYEFELKEGDKVVATAKNAADGTVTFEAIEYAVAGDHTYTITEKAGSEAGVTYDKSTHNVIVNVTDNGQGKLVADVTDNNPTFTNTYKATSTTATITAKKVLNGKELEAGKYEFELKEGDKVVATAKNAADGTVTFEAIEYAAEGNHTYTITEKAGSEAGVTYDTAKHEVKVAVTDNGQGQLVVAVTDNNPTFTNTYVTSSTQVTFTAKKILKGKALEAGKYEFELKEGDKVIGTATNAADGTVAFAGIEYKEAGEHTYTISEKAGSEAGVTYDTTKHEVKVAVTDNGQGQLVATVTGVDSLIFTNVYTVKPTIAKLTANTVLNGKVLEAGKYEFELKEGDTVVATAKNAADGTVTFKAIEYTTAGKHTYTISEKAGQDKNIKYDENSYKVTVEVVDNGAGKLVATVTDNNPTFTNKYTEPKKEEPKEGPKGEQPKGDLPNTGGADFTAFSTILGLVLAALAGLVYRAKKVD